MAITDDIVATDDGSMVKVVMTNENLRSGEPFSFLGVDQALYLESKGACIIVRKSNPGNYEMTPDGRVMIKMVKHLEKKLIESYGPYGFYPRESAEIGDRKGKWKIVGKGEQKKGYGGQVVVARLPGLSTDDVLPGVYETKGVKKNRVAWVQDDFRMGGAELSNQTVIEVGIDCGFEIELVTQKTDPAVVAKILAGVDVIVINNIWGFSQEHMDCLLRAIYVDRVPYVKYEHDHRELDRPEFSRRLFQNSKLNVFLSPAHLENHKRSLGVDGVCLPLALDVDFFKPVPSVERKKGSALVCNVRNFKLWTNLQKYVDDHPEISFTVLADEEGAVRGKNVGYKPMVSYEKMPEIYSSHEYVVHLLDGLGAGERVIFEGALCGCKVISDGHSGHMSWNLDLSDAEGLREELRGAPYQFWRKVDSIL